MTESAAQLRREAVARIGDIAGFPSPPMDVDLVLARPHNLRWLIRRALGEASPDRLLLEEVALLAPVAQGHAHALDDAIHQHGLPQRTPDRDAPSMTTEDLARVLEEVLRE
jgi:hypothetical protein